METSEKIRNLIYEDVSRDLILFYNALEQEYLKLRKNLKLKWPITAKRLQRLGYALTFDDRDYTAYISLNGVPVSNKIQRLKPASFLETPNWLPQYKRFVKQDSI